MSITKLQEENEHERDKYLSFDEKKHIYTIKSPRLEDTKGEKYVSVTTWIKGLFEKFDSDKVINNMMKSKKWPDSPYYGMTKSEIKEKWNKNGKEAAEKGTRMHYNIECYYNEVKNIVDDSVEFKYFHDFERERNQDLVPYRTEWMVYDEDMKIAGSIDMVYRCKESGKLHIYDWKRCKDIKKTNPWQSSIHRNLDHIPDTNYWHYALQLNIYKAIIERKYGEDVEDLNLVCLHPENSGYLKIKIPVLKDEICELVDDLVNKHKHI